MKKRERSLLVLSPQVRGANQLRDYKPFGGRLLAAMLRDVATSASHRQSRLYDEHAIFSGFLFGRVTLEPALVDALRNLPCSLIDCAIDASDEANAVAAARKALFHFAEGVPAGAKSMALMCTHDCQVDVGFDAQRIRNDDTLFAHLW